MNIFSNYFYFRYPQYNWAKEIKIILDSNIIADVTGKNLIDAPSGDGVISFWLKKKINNKFYLFDIEKTSIQIAQDKIKGAVIQKENIIYLNLNPNENIWLFINSLYCMTDKTKLLKSMVNQMEYIIAIFPYINHLNYKTFFQQNPKFINYSEMDKEQTILFFKEFNYDLIYDKDITYIPFYKIYNVFHYFNSIINKICILLDRFFQSRHGAYWIGVFKRTN
jgi:hypothetical protein